MKAIASNSTKLYLEESNRRLEELVLIARNDLDHLARITVEGLIVIDVHGLNNVLYSCSYISPI
jgi:hypothetical protein